MNKKIYSLLVVGAILIFSIVGYNRFFIKETILNYGLANNQQTPVGEITEKMKIIQYIHPIQKSLTGIDLQFATYGRKNNSDLNIKVLNGNNLVYSNTINAATIEDNRFLRVSFPVIEEPEKLTLEITSSNGREGNAATLWKGDNNRIGDLIINNTKIEGALNVKLVYETTNYKNILGLFIITLGLLSIIWREKLVRKVNTYFNNKALVFNVLLTSLLLLVGMCVLFIRSSDAFLFPILYAEDGAFTGHLLSRNFFEVAFTVKEDFPVMGIIIPLQLGLYLSKLLYGYNLEFLSLIIALLSNGFIVLVATVGFFVFKKYYSKLTAILFYTLTLIMPLGYDMNEVYGRSLNLGFLFPVLTILLLIWRYNQSSNNKKMIVIDLYNVISCLTLPVGFGIVGFYLFLDYIDKRKTYSSVLLIKRFAFPFVTLLSGFYFLPSLLHSKGGAGGLVFVKEKFIEFAIARNFLYPFGSGFWSHLNDKKVIIIFIGYLFIISLPIFIKIGHSKKWHLFLLGSTFIYWVGIVVPRIGFTSLFNGYTSTFPDRYFYGINLLSVTLLFSALYMISSKWKKADITRAIAVCIIILSLCKTPNIIEFNKPAMAWREIGTLKESTLIEMKNVNKHYRSSDPKIPVQSYPYIDRVNNPWRVEMPVIYAENTALSE